MKSSHMTPKALPSEQGPGEAREGLKGQEARLRKILLKYALLLGGCLLYLQAVLLTGLSLPCYFHLLTGLLCPGCGITRMLTALLQGDLAAAWQANGAVLAALPLLLALIIYDEAQYVRARPAHVPDWLLWLLLAYFGVFGVVRNLV